MPNFLFRARTVRPRPSRARADEYSRNYRNYYLRDASPHKKRAPQRSRYLSLLVYSLLATALLLKWHLTRRGSTKPAPASRNPQQATTREPAGAAAEPRGSKPDAAVPVSGAEVMLGGVRVEAEAEAEMRPPQFGLGAERDVSAREAVRALDHMLLGGDDELDVTEVRGGGGGTGTAGGGAGREAVEARRHVWRDVGAGERESRTCYHSGVSGDAVCVHVPFCVRHVSIVYLGSRLRCAAYSNKQGKLGTLSMGRCVELEREVERVGEIEQVEHKGQEWVDALQREGNVLWFEGDSVFVRMGKRCKNVMHFAERVLLVHHILHHPERYAMGAISNIVIAADEEVARKIRYTKSWHHGLLAAVVYPNRILYSHKAVRDIVTQVPQQPGEIRVFVPGGGIWEVAKGRQVPCFRRAALPGSVRSQLLLSEDVYPGVVDALATMSRTRYFDADVFRTQLYRSLGYGGAPAMRREIVYLHRASTRSFSASALAVFEDKVRAVGQAGGFTYRRVDVAGMTFPQQVEAVMGAAVVVGIHGMQMLNVLFLPSGAGVVEVFPYGFKNGVFAGGSGAGLFYRAHEIVRGVDYEGVGKYKGGVDECMRDSKQCREWYQSDGRAVEFDELDAAAVGNLVQQAMSHAGRSLPAHGGNWNDAAAA
eukprot:GFKZ01001138.1.p1 GENE.GFKZ01001138.1~~GFKZ01001138.1.p1  ORF type:complete len:651 (-),score=50.52 GFKZ01001138.1:621-2573(-)